jgi:1-aminocyclopropane-1-carboxylate deaminase
MLLIPKLLPLEQSLQPSPLVPICDPLLQQHGIELWLKRDDLLHPIMSGNKWRKLKYSLNHALWLGKNTLISMGGIYSNHLHALAYIGKMLEINTIGLVRGEAPTPLTPMLQDVQNWGMVIQYFSRSQYRQLRQYRQFDSLPDLKSGQYWLAEGGAHAFALQGVKELANEINIPYDTLCVACGTGTTLAGLAGAVPESVHIIGFVALKHGDFLQHDIQALMPLRCNWQLNHDYHFGGFGQTHASLLAFMERFEHDTTIPLEPIYTGKMLYGIYDLIKQGHFKPGHRIVAIHTGGLQGKR